MIKSKITLKQLEAFVFVVDTGTFRAAASALGTTQPNISARIAALETALDVVLLHRDAGSVRLTTRGEALLAEARKVLLSAEALLEEAGRRDLIDERLRLGVTELVACTWLQDFLRRLKLAYPKVRVELQVDLSTEIERNLVERNIDLAFQNAPFRVKTGGDIPLGSEAYVWAAHPALADLLGPAPELPDVFGHPVLMHARHTVAARSLYKMAVGCGLPVEKIVHSSALSACLPMALDGMGVALLPEALLRPALRAGTLRELDCGWLPEPLTFHARFDPSRSPGFVAAAARLALETVRADNQEK